MANIAQTVNVLQAMILTEGTGLVKTPTYHVFEMNAVHHDAWLLETDLECGKYEYTGSQIASLSASASIDETGAVHLTVSNLNPVSDALLEIDLRGMPLQNADIVVSARTLTAPRMDAHNTFENPDTVCPMVLNEITQHRGHISAKLPAKSVSVFEMKQR
jgi:alpha-N-arabinofuranosidase